MLAKSLLDLIVCAKLRLQDSLPVFFLLDLFMNFGDLISSFADLLGLVAWVQDHIVVETLLEACLLSQEFVGLLLVLAQAVVQRVNLGLVLNSDSFNRRVHVSLSIAVGANAGAHP